MFLLILLKLAFKFFFYLRLDFSFFSKCNDFDLSQLKLFPYLVSFTS